ncbi:MAG: hypothetical protein NTX76_01435 [Alphaproteobacteria bacterium]|nr:hypothetical protein [Alphaproteobacteria bacterium]
MKFGKKILIDTIKVALLSASCLTVSQQFSIAADDTTEESEEKGKHKDKPGTIVEHCKKFVKKELDTARPKKDQEEFKSIQSHCGNIISDYKDIAEKHKDDADEKKSTKSDDADEKKSTKSDDAEEDTEKKSKKSATKDKD